MTIEFGKYAYISNKIKDGIYLSDNIAIATLAIKSQSELQLDDCLIITEELIESGEFFAIKDILRNKEIIVHGVPIGKSKYSIKPGQKIIGSSIETCFEESIIEKNQCAPLPKYNIIKSGNSYTFEGFERIVSIDGKVGGGTQNLVAIVNTVKCSEIAARNIAYKARRELLPKYENITDFVAITHEYGCGMPFGEAVDFLSNILIRIMNHPNIGVVLLLSFGCEKTNPVPFFENNIHDKLVTNVINYRNRVSIEVLQEYDSEFDATNKIVNYTLKKLCNIANRTRRQTLPLEYLTLGLKCGGSDSFSGICANPVIGVASDMLVDAGGASILTETTELDGCQSILCERAADINTRNWLNQLLPRFDKASRKYPIPATGRQSISPGNKNGGLFNIYMKSGGAVKKSGSSLIQGGLEYGDSIYDKKHRGLWVLDCPSYDQISTPALGLSGAQIVLFSTGLGTTIGSAISQVIKVGNRKSMGLSKEIDFFAEDILFHRTIDELGEELFNMIISTASGKYSTAIERLNKNLVKENYSETHHEFMIWKKWPDN